MQICKVINDGTSDALKESFSDLWQEKLGILGLKKAESSKGSTGTTGSSEWEYIGEPVLQPGQIIWTAGTV